MLCNKSQTVYLVSRPNFLKNLRVIRKLPSYGSFTRNAPSPDQTRQNCFVASRRARYELVINWRCRRCGTFNVYVCTIVLLLSMFVYVTVVLLFSLIFVNLEYLLYDTVQYLVMNR